MADLGYYKMHALIVDDFENFRGTLYKMLMDLGIGNADSAASGEEALRFCKARSYDIILCDNNLGKGKSGQQVLEELRSTDNPCSDSLFILVSAENSKGTIMAAYDYEPDAYLAKPITPKALDQRLGRLIEQRVELKAVHAAQKSGDDELAITLCKELVASGSRYANACQKLLGQLYLKKNNLTAAEAVYRAVLDNRELEWAQLGMVKTKLAQNDLLGAQQWLENILQANPLCMKAYDLQADLYKLQNDSEGLQNVLQKATDISPLSILRQQALGDVAQQNNDLVTAANALKRAVKLGENSCFDKAEVHSLFAQTTIDLFSIDKELAKPLIREAIACVNNLEENFGKTNLRKVESLLLESQLQVCAGDQRRAQDALASAQSSLGDTKDEDALSVQIELVRTLRFIGKTDDAQRLLGDLLHRYAGKEEQLQRLDVLLDEPRSEKNKLMVAEINKKGIAFYNAKDFTAAADAFKTALQKLPNHIGLRLNYVQAMIDKLKTRFESSVSEKIQQTFTKTSAIISQQHPQFQRYRQLNDVYNSLVRAYEKDKRG
ncbi:response regulator [Cellvibrio fibrivorans]|uniref:CheY-like chemotaxis protein n=1 Tax=Cellvibrio fibrivorans TaxID=126350 RepID=A0ABU1UWJ7_9GAMM|nr:response regulator [Cellvibrio fibrivorans]MDR7089567.1 CheY-like chemotaxis protein [Cellvibrio fibrivorans]